MHKSKAALFLMELLIVLLFFSVACAVCLQLFFHAHKTNRESSDLSNANILFTNAAEDFYHDSAPEASENTAFFDSDLNSCDPSCAAFTVTSNITYNSDENRIYDNISVKLTGDEQILISKELVRYERLVKP